MSGLEIEIFDRVGGGYCSALLRGKLEIGRQFTENNQGVGPLLKVFRNASGTDRINIAPADEVTISRDQLLLEPASGARPCHAESEQRLYRH